MAVAEPFAEAPFGIVGLETALALTLTHLVGPGHVPLARAIELWTDEPRCFLATVCRDSRRCEAILLDERFHGVGWLPPSPELEESPLPSP